MMTDMPDCYRFLLFDADHTLLDFDADMTRAFERLYEHCRFGEQIPYSPAMLETYETCNNRWWGNFEAGKCAKPELFRSRFVDFLNETGLSADPDEMNTAYFEFLGQGGITYPGALELLEELTREHEIYIITNGNAASQMTRLEHSGLMPYVREVFVSEAVGVGKPDRRYFDYVAKHIPGFVKEQALVIGDSLPSDIQGAVNAGIDSIWYRPAPQRRGPETSVAFTYCAESYEDILHILKNR